MCLLLASKQCDDFNSGTVWAKYILSSVVPPDPSVHFYHWVWRRYALCLNLVLDGGPDTPTRRDNFMEVSLLNKFE